MNEIKELKLIYDTSKSTEEKLDILLDMVRNLQPFFVADVIKHFICNPMEFDALKKHLLEIDKLIEFDSERPVSRKSPNAEYGTIVKADFYRLTVKGMMFKGYVSNKRNELILKALRFSATMAIVLGTLAAGAYGIWQMWLYYHPCN